MKDNFLGFLAVVGVFGIIVTPIASWFTHVIVCIQTEAWGFLVAGAIFFPVGVVHGVGIWLGIW